MGRHSIYIYNMYDGHAPMSLHLWLGITSCYLRGFVTGIARSDVDIPPPYARLTIIILFITYLLEAPARFFINPYL